MRGHAVSQVKVDEALVRNAYVFRDCLEVRDGLFVLTAFGQALVDADDADDADDGVVDDDALEQRTT